MGHRCVLSCWGESKKTSLFIYYTENTLKEMEHSALHIDLEHPKHARWVICVEIMMRSQWDTPSTVHKFSGCVKPAVASAVWVASLGWSCRWRSRGWRSEDWCGDTWSAIVRLVGCTGKFSGSLVYCQWRWFGVMRWTFLKCYGDQPRAHLCINLLYNLYLEYIKKSTSLCEGWVLLWLFLLILS